MFLVSSVEDARSNKTKNGRHSCGRNVRNKILHDDHDSVVGKNNFIDTHGRNDFNCSIYPV